MEGSKLPIIIGVSSCLLGQTVRYDGGHKLDRFLKNTLGQYVEYFPVCPEVEAGFGIPRESIRLTGDPRSPGLVTTESKIDYTEPMNSWAKKRVKEIGKENLCGFIFKSKSPSCGIERVKVYSHRGTPAKKGVGIFARIFMETFPLIPVEEDGRLHDPVLRKNFIERIFALRQWREILTEKKSLGHLVGFHTRNKMLILSHSEKHYRFIGKRIAEGKGIPVNRMYSIYEQQFMEALKRKSTPAKNTNVLMHMMGYFKKQLSRDEKQELLEYIDQYRQGYLPLLVPLTLINHYVRKFDQKYLKMQSYLNPHHLELKLRNHT